MTIKASNKVTAAAERQAQATEATVATALEQLELGRNQLTQSIRPWLTIGSGKRRGTLVWVPCQSTTVPQVTTGLRAFMPLCESVMWDQA